MSLPDSGGHYDIFGGRYVPEALDAALEQLERECNAALADDDFLAEFRRLLVDYAGRPSPLTEASRLSEHAGNATILLEEAIFERALSGALESISAA